MDQYIVCKCHGEELSSDWIPVYPHITGDRAHLLAPAARRWVQNNPPDGGWRQSVAVCRHKAYTHDGKYEGVIMAEIQRPDYVKDEHLEFLDELRDSGDTNMFGARPYLMNEFWDLTKQEAAAILTYWMGTFGERHP